MSTSFIFPGQGSQKIGMGAAIISGFKVGAETVDEIEDAISFKILKVINEGTEDELTATQNSQIALFTVSMAILNVLKYEFGFNVEQNVQFLAGHSLGEYTALCAASVISLSDAAKLVRRRGEIMAGAAGDEKFSMAAIISLDIGIVEELVAPYHTGRNICSIANDNSEAQVVISGHADAVEKVSEEALQRGAKKAIKLNTSGPFHSPLMGRAAAEMDAVIKQFAGGFKEPKIPVIMNTTASVLESVDQLNLLLVQQMTNRVRWRETIELMIKSGVKNFVEIGSGKVLTKFSKRIYPELNMFGIENIAEIEAFLNASA